MLLKRILYVEPSTPRSMSEFGKTPREPYWKQLFNAFLRLFRDTNRGSFGGHYDRIQQQRRDTELDK